MNIKEQVNFFRQRFGSGLGVTEDIFFFFISDPGNQPDEIFQQMTVFLFQLKGVDFRHEKTHVQEYQAGNDGR